MENETDLEILHDFHNFKHFMITVFHCLHLAYAWSMLGMESYSHDVEMNSHSFLLKS